MADITFRSQPARGPTRGTCLFLHGAGGSSLVWLAQLRALPAGWQAMAPDLPGPGPPPASVGEYADRVEGLLAARPPAGPRLVAIGHSLGGAVALTLALRRRVPLHGLVLVGTAARFRVDPSFLRRFMAGEHHLAFGPEAPPDLIQLSRRQWEKGDPATALAAFAAAGGHDSRGRLGEVTLPTLVVCGTEDRFTPPALARELARGLPDCRLEILPGAGHLPMVEQPAWFARLLGSFLRGLEATGR